MRIPRRASRRAAEDTLRYRRNYPVSPSDKYSCDSHVISVSVVSQDIPTGKFLPYLNDNSDFYQNRRAAYPCGMTIINNGPSLPEMRIPL